MVCANSIWFVQVDSDGSGSIEFMEFLLLMGNMLRSAIVYSIPAESRFYGIHVTEKFCNDGKILYRRKSGILAEFRNNPVSNGIPPEYESLRNFTDTHEIKSFCFGVTCSTNH